MRRRALLRGAGATAGLLAVPPVVGATSSANRPDSRRGADYEPLGSVRVYDAAEAVVDDAGETTYVATGDGFETVDVSDPRAPEVLATVDDVAADREDGPLESILDVKLSGERLLVSGPAQRGELKGLLVYDVSDPSDPAVDVEFFRTGFRIHNADFDGEYAYLSASPGRDGGISIVDLAIDPPEFVATWSPLDADPGVEGWSELRHSPSGCHDLTVHGDRLYCAYWDAGTWILDVSDPSAPSYVGHAGDYSLETLVEEDRLGGFEAPGNDHYANVDDDASLLAVGAEAWDRPEVDRGGPGGIDLWDVSDPADPRRRSTIEPPEAEDETLGGTWTTAHNFELRGDRLYSAWYQGGVRLHDVSDPANPEQLAWWRHPDETLFWTARVAVPGEYFVASSHGDMGFQGRLYVFPDRAGEQPDPPGGVYPPGSSIPAATPTRTRTRTRTATETTTPTGTATGTPTRTATRTRTDPATGTGTPTETTVQGDPGSGGRDGSETPTSTADDGGQGMPGFGVVAALAGLGIGGYRYLRSHE